MFPLPDHQVHIAKSPSRQVHIAKLSSPCHQSHQFAKCALPNYQVHVIKITNLRSAHCQIVKSMSSIHIINATLPSHQVVKCTLSNCRVHVINPNHQCHIAKSPSTCRLPIKLSKIMKVYGWPNSWIFFLTFLTSICISKHCPKKKIAHN